jgi:hypothetical protein
MPIPPRLSRNRACNTASLKRQLRARRHKGRQLTKQLRDAHDKHAEHALILRHIRECLQGAHDKNNRFHAQLRGYRERKAPASDAPPEETAADLDRDMNRLGRALTSVHSYIGNEERSKRREALDMERLSRKITEFVHDTVEEVNRVTTESRCLRFGDDPMEMGGARQQQQQQQQHGGEHRPTVLMTSMFRLYEHDRDTNVDRVLGGRKRK